MPGHAQPRQFTTSDLGARSTMRFNTGPTDLLIFTASSSSITLTKERILSYAQ